MNFVGMAQKIPGNFPVVVTGNNREDFVVQLSVDCGVCIGLRNMGGNGKR